MCALRRRGGEEAPGSAPAEGTHPARPGTATSSRSAYSAVTEHPGYTLILHSIK